MQRSARKNPRLLERLNAIQREMSHVQREIQETSQFIENPERAKRLRREKKSTVEPLTVREGVTERIVPRSESFEASSPSQPGATPSSGSEALSDADSLNQKLPADQRFVNYFVTGGLHSVRPLRQERRIQRNKAILMSVIAAAVLYGVISLLL